MSTIINRRDFLRRSLVVLGVLSSPATLARRLWALSTEDPGNFRKIYLDPRLRERFFPFLKNVFHLFPEQRFHELILELAKKDKTDEEIYKELQRRMPEIKALAGGLTYALPALKKQKTEMTREALGLLGEKKSISGYLEIGTTGRYVSALRHQIRIKGPIYLVNDIAATYGVSEIAERGGIPKIGTYVPMGDYDIFAGVKVPEGSIEVVTNFIGFHHCPIARLEGFVGSIRRVLKPSGRLLLRDHDVDEPEQETIVALAHDVFNAGVALTWDENHKQLRLFRSMDQWTKYLIGAGFKRSEKPAVAQKGDPTKNLLVEFVRA